MSEKNFRQSVKEGFKNVDDDMKEIRREVSTVKGMVEDVEKRILEEISKEIEVTDEDVVDVNGKMSKIEEDIQKLSKYREEESEASRKREKRIDDAESGISSLEEDLGELDTSINEKMDELTEKIDRFRNKLHEFISKIDKNTEEFQDLVESIKVTSEDIAGEPAFKEAVGSVRDEMDRRMNWFGARVGATITLCFGLTAILLYWWTHA